MCNFILYCIIILYFSKKGKKYGFIKKASFIKKSSLTLLIIFACIFAIAIILSIAAGASLFSDSLTVDGATAIVVAAGALWIVTAVFAIVYYIFCIINAVFIFSTDWKNPKLMMVVAKYFEVYLH